MSEELIRQRLYRIFRVEEESYMITMKVLYIYRCIQKESPDMVFEIIAELRQGCKMRKNTERVDMIFRRLQAVNSAHLAAPATARPPMHQSTYYGGWKLG